MNMFQNTTSGAGMLKPAYPSGGPVAQMNAKPEMVALRKRRDLVAKKQTIQGEF
jgi:hypothetical protein